MISAVLGWCAVALVGLFQGVAVNWITHIFWNPPWFGYQHYVSGWWAGFYSLLVGEILAFLVFRWGFSLGRPKDE